MLASRGLMLQMLVGIDHEENTFISSVTRSEKLDADHEFTSDRSQSQIQLRRIQNPGFENVDSVGQRKSTMNRGRGTRNSDS